MARITLERPNNDESPSERGFRPNRWSGLAVIDVHRDFETEAHFGEFRLGPHSVFSRKDMSYHLRFRSVNEKPDRYRLVRTRPHRQMPQPHDVRVRIHCARRDLALTQQYQQILLMIIMKL
jgi:hypothetical protein